MSMQFIIPGVIDYNFLIFREGISQVFELRSKKKLEAEEDQFPLSTSVVTTGSHQYTWDILNDLNEEI